MKTKTFIRPCHEGPEAANWAEMLAAMYRDWHSSMGVIATWDIIAYVFTLFLDSDDQPLMDEEYGIHQLCFNSPFDPEHRRQSCFVSVYPESIPNDLTQELVRSFVLDPYKSAKDLRTDKEVSGIEVDAVLAGQLDLLRD